MSEKKVETFIYEDLGFPIKLINAPMKKIYGQWFLDINLSKFQKSVLLGLVNKPFPLVGEEIRFIRKYFEMTTTDFGHVFGTTHPAVLKWEKKESRMNPATEVYMRLYVLDRLQIKDKEFRRLYHKISIDSLIKHRKAKVKTIPFEIDALEESFAL
jgi:DNA-binding transcriptional regulator YiaG